MYEVRRAEAEACFREAAALCVEMGDKRNEMHARQGLYECLYKTEPDSARAEMARFLALRDSIYNMESAESLARYNAEFGNDFLVMENEAARRQRIWMIIGGLVGLLLIAGTVVLLWRRKSRRQQADHERLEAQIAREQQKTKAAAFRSTDTGSSEKEFVADTHATILRLMPEGQVTVEKVASELSLSPSQFRRKIQAATGLSASDYMMSVRMEEARKLLAEYPKYTFNDIATRCGFADNAHFTHTFKRIYHTTPSEFISLPKD